MKDFKGTKGEWHQSHLIVDVDGNYYTQVYNEEGETICKFDWYPIKQGNETITVREANSKLIAAAPELLEALQNLINHVDKTTSGHRARSKAEAVIEKALK